MWSKKDNHHQYDQYASELRGPGVRRDCFASADTVKWFSKVIVPIYIPSSRKGELPFTHIFANTL